MSESNNSRRPFLEVTWQGRQIGASAASVEVEDHDRLCDRAKIVLQDPNAIGSATVQEGQEIKIDMGWMTEHAVLFDGLVTRSRVEAAEGTRRLTITALDRSQVMNRQAKSRTFDSGTLSSVLRSVVSEHQIPVGQISPDSDPAFTRQSPARQSNQTDLQFVQGLALRYGARAFVEFDEDRTKFFFVGNRRLQQADRLGTLRYCHGIQQIIRFRFERVASGASAQRSATTVDSTTGETVTAAPTEPRTDPAPAASAQQQQVLSRAGGDGEATLAAAQTAAATARERPSAQVRQSRASGLPSSPDRARLATAPDPARLSGLRGEGLAVGTVLLRAKGKVEILGIAPWAEGDWYVQKATHVVRDRTYQTSFVVTR